MYFYCSCDAIESDCTYVNNHSVLLLLFKILITEPLLANIPVAAVLNPIKYLDVHKCTNK